MEINTKFNTNDTVHAIICGQEQVRTTCKVCNGNGNITVPNYGGVSCPSCYGRCYTEISRPQKWYIPSDLYYHFKIKKIGVERVEWLEENGNQVKKWTIDELKEIIETYKAKVKELS